MSAFVEFHNVKKIYHSGEVKIEALHDVNFQIEQGEFCVVVGASGERDIFMTSRKNTVKSRVLAA